MNAFVRRIYQQRDCTSTPLYERQGVHVDVCSALRINTHHHQQQQQQQCHLFIYFAFYGATFLAIDLSSLRRRLSAGESAWKLWLHNFCQGRDSRPGFSEGIAARRAPCKPLGLGTHTDPKHCFTTSFLQGRCRKAMLGGRCTLSKHPATVLQPAAGGIVGPYRDLVSWGA